MENIERQIASAVASYYSNNIQEAIEKAKNIPNANIDLFLSKCYLALRDFSPALRHILIHLGKINYSFLGWSIFCQVMNNIELITREQNKIILNYLRFYLSIPTFNHSNIQLFFPRLFKTKLTPDFNDIISEFNEGGLREINESFEVPELLLMGLTKIYIMDFTLENLFRHVRRLILLGNYKGDHTNFLSCLGIQCFLNEFIYNEDEEERSLVKLLLDKIQGSPSVQDIALLSCYYPLYKLKNCT